MLITLKDGKTMALEAPITGLELAGKLSQALKKEALAMHVNGKLEGLATQITDDAQVEFLTFADEDGRKVTKAKKNYDDEDDDEYVWEFDFDAEEDEGRYTYTVVAENDDGDEDEATFTIKVVD